MSNFKIKIRLDNCKICKSSPVIHRKHTNELLCPKCFCRKIEKIISYTIQKHDMIQSDDKIIVGLSGGKDSIALLYNLNLQKSNCGLKNNLIALIIDEGISGYRDQSIILAKNFCEELEINYEIFSFKKFIGKNLDEIVKMKNKSSNSRYACNYCAILRRRLLNEGARKLKGDLLAVGHNLTDISESFLMNIVYKRFKLIGHKFFKNSNKDRISSIYIKKVKPLMYIPEEEIFLYNSIKKLPFYASHCPYSQEDPIIRKQVLQFIQSCKNLIPDIESKLLDGYMMLSSLLSENLTEMKNGLCPECGYPSNKNLKCSYCQIKAGRIDISQL